jgi:hypothetical protein
MKTKFKVGTQMECYDNLTTFKGTIRGTGTVEWCNVDGITKPRDIYLIEGTWDKETNVEWFEVPVRTLDKLIRDCDITILN